MKKIYNTLLVALSLLAFTACETDRDSNPTLNEPDSFVLNLPPYAENNVYDLENSTSISLTCSQPDYGIPMATTYTVQMSLTEDFIEADEATETAANYITLSTVYTNTKINIDALELALAVIELWDATGSGDFPTTAIPLYFRLKAHLTSAATRGVCYSNTIKLPNVLGYKAEAPIELPAEMYMTGSFEGGNSWTTWLQLQPVTEMPGKFWRIQYFASGDQFKFSTMADWGGDTGGYTDGMIPAASAELANAGGVDNGMGGQNITVGKAGWYIVVMTAKLAGTEIGYTLDFYEANVYLMGGTALDSDTWSETEVMANAANKFTAPAGPGDFEITIPKGGDLRIFAKIPDVDWWRSEFVAFDEGIEYRENRGELGGQEIATNVAAGQKVKLNFITGTSSVE